MRLTCSRCQYTWNTQSTKHRICCSKCKTSITPLHKPRQGTDRVYMPLSVADKLNKFMLARLMGIAHSNGEDNITFKINRDGVMYL